MSRNQVSKGFSIFYILKHTQQPFFQKLLIHFSLYLITLNIFFLSCVLFKINIMLLKPQNDVQIIV